MAPAICGETLKRPGSLTSTSLPLPSISTMRDFAVAVDSAPLRRAAVLRSARAAWPRLRAALRRAGNAQALLHLGRRLDRAARPTGCGRALRRPAPRRSRNSSTAVPGSSRSRYCAKPFGEQHRLVMAARIGQPDDAHLVAGLGAPLGARDHGAGDPAGAGAGLTARANSAQDCTRSRLSAAA